MENITEFLVKKKKTGADEMKSFLVVLSAFILIVICTRFSGTALGALSIIAVALVVYLAYRVMLRFDMEFEYCIVDKEIRIDKILGKKKRKDFVSVEGDEIEFVAKKDELHDSELQNAKIIMAAESADEKDNYVVKAHKGGNAMCIIIKGDERVLAHLKRVMPSKVR